VIDGAVLSYKKIPECLEKSLLPRAKKQPDFQVTSCHHFYTTNSKIDDLWKSQTSNFS
jgi:hypothetical protein